MQSESDVREIIELAEEIRAQKRYRDQFVENVNRATNDAQRELLLMGRPTQEHLDHYNRHLMELLNRIDRADQRIMAEFEELPAAPLPEREAIVSSRPKEKKETFYISKRTRKRYLKDIGANERTLKRILHPRERAKKEFREIEYTIYQPSWYGRMANVFYGGTTRHLMRTYPKVFENLAKAIRSSDLLVLSRTYISMMLFTSMIGFFAALFGSLVGGFFLGLPILFAAFVSILLGCVAAVIVTGIFFLYPSAVVGSRNRMIRNDLPFVIIHMAAVAGSGAKPLSMFKLIANSGEYKGLEGEIKKILNYVNLFGYNITTALKSVAVTTPSPRFRDLLNGMVATIESGGSLKSYLSSMAADAMHTYSLERKKYVQVLSTYSDVYTGILIAAPLLFIVTLAIINLLGGTVGGISVKAITLIGTYVFIPLLNIFFLLFLNIVQPEL